MEADQEKQTTLPIESSFRIFVSHSHKDNDFCLKLVHDLRSYLNDYDAVWHDGSGGLHGGEAWWRKIVREVGERNVFIVVVSPDAMESDWVNDEIDLAWQRKNSPAGMLIIPVLYRESDMRNDLKTRQIVSFLPPKPYEIAFQELLLALERSLYPQSKTPPTLPPLRTSPLRRPTREHQAPPIRAQPQSQMFADMPDLEKLVPMSSKQEEILPLVSRPAVTPPASEPVIYADAEEIPDIPQYEASSIKFAIGKLSDFQLWFFLILEVILAMRFLFRVIGADPSNPFAGFIYALTDVILLPFTNIVASASLGPNRYLEWTTLIGMLIYWIVSWALKRFLRILVSVPEEPVE